MKKILTLFAVGLGTFAFSQIRYSGKVDAFFNINLFRTVTVEA